MTLNLSIPQHEELKPRITVFGVGGAGGNAVNNMIEKALEGVEFVVANTDAQALQQSSAPAKVQMGVKVTEGLGAGARPSVGAAAAEETIEEIIDHLAGAHMCFITAGMGGGTGTGAAPIIAQAARELGVLTVGVVTKPFQFEGAKRMRQAEEGIESLQKMVDTLIIIPIQNLFRLANENTTFTEAFALADDVLYQGVKGVTDLMVQPGLINLDFADVRSVMDEMGKAMMGTGEAEGEDRAVQAAEKAIANPLLDEISLKGARGVLINITGGYDLTLFELDEAANRIRTEVDPEANIIVGSTLDPEISGVMRVSVVATGIEAEEARRADPARPAGAAGGRAPEARRAADEPAPEAEAARAAPPAPAEVHEPAARADREATRRVEATPIFDDADAPLAEAPAEPEPDRAASPFERDGAFIAPAAETPRAPAPGEPSPKTLRRLQAAVSHPGAADARRPEPRPAAATPVRPAAHPAPQAAPQPGTQAAHDPGGERGRFGINSLIGRMTGGQGGAQNPRAAEPSLHRGGEDPAEADRQREIPAFLRRQAN